jgi:ABC-2 type transport system permease protein
MALIQNENMKIYRRARTWVLAGICIGLPLFIAVLLLTVDKGAVDHMLDYMAMAAGSASLATVFTVVVAGDAVASEFSWGTVKLLLIRPAKRWKILLAKYIASLLFAAFLLVLIFVCSALIGLVCFGTGGTVDDDVRFGRILGEYGLQAVTLVVIATFSFMISSVFRSNTLAIVLALAVLFLGGTISSLLVALDQEWAKFLLFLNMDLSMYFNEHFEPPFPGMTLGFSVAVLVVYMIVFHLIAFWVFNKRDVSF